MVINTAFYPTLMWNSRFHAPSGDPFDNSKGFAFPDPEGTRLSYLPHLLTAQAFIPPVERVEMSGFHFPGTNDDLRAEVLRRLNDNRNYRRIFAHSFPHVKRGDAISFDDIGRAIAEFEFTLTFADAQDFGLEQASGLPGDRYAFRTSPLRNVALQLFFMHNGAFSRLEDAIRYHLDALGGAATYTTAGLPADLQGPIGPMLPVLERLDPRLRTRVQLDAEEFAALVDFVRNGLLDPAATPQRLRHLIPEILPSGRPRMVFQ